MKTLKKRILEIRDTLSKIRRGERELKEGKTKITVKSLKPISKHTVIILVTIVCQAILYATFVSGNEAPVDTENPLMGINISPMEEIDIALESETVTMIVNVDFTECDVTCTFITKSYSKDRIIRKVGFPFEYFTNYENMESFRVFNNDKKVETKLLFNELNKHWSSPFRIGELNKENFKKELSDTHILVKDLLKKNGIENDLSNLSDTVLTDIFNQLIDNPEMYKFMVIQKNNTASDTSQHKRKDDLSWIRYSNKSDLRYIYPLTFEKIEKIINFVKYKVFFVWETEWEPEQTVTTVCKYKTFNVWRGPSFKEIKYITKTGKLWKDKIKSADFSVRFIRKPIFEKLNVTPKTEHITDTEIRWHFNNWEPDEDIVVSNIESSYRDYLRDCCGCVVILPILLLVGLMSKTK